MTVLPECLSRLALPVIGAPMFTVSTPQLVVAQCRAGIVGAMPALNARSTALLDEALHQIRGELAAFDRQSPQRPAAPFAINLIVHKDNQRLEQDLQVCERHRVPVLITSLGAREDVNQAARDWGATVFHAVIHNTHARKAVEKGAHGLVAVTSGAGGHTGARSPFALVQEIRQWFDGPLALSGAIATGRGILAAQALGADLAYIGSAFIPAEESAAAPEYKQALVAATSDDVICTSAVTGVPANFMAGSLRKAGLLEPERPQAAGGESLGGMAGDGVAKPWKDIWSCGQGVGAIRAVEPAAEVVQRLAREYRQARTLLAAMG